ncbi:hypothetical protein BGZ94_001814 [Podila epigama]|nr:hypothetical protein BGZ94_001814 [Podila epigama]
MKFSSAILLVSAALATLATAAPVVLPEPNLDLAKVGTVLTKRCGDCTHKDAAALDIIVKASADHYSNIAHVRLDGLLSEIQTAKVTSESKDLPQEKAALTITVQSKIEEAKKACAPDALAPVIKASVASDANLDVAWSQKEEIEKKMAELDVLITKLMLDRIQANINAEALSKDCTEKMTNTEIVPAPVAAESVPAPAPAPVAPAASETVPEAAPAPAPVTPEAAPAPAPGIDVPSEIDSKFVCKVGCRDTNQAKNVLHLRVTLQNEFEPRLNHFYKEEVPSDCTEKRSSLLGGVLALVANLNVNA